MAMEKEHQYFFLYWLNVEKTLSYNFASSTEYPAFPDKSYCKDGRMVWMNIVNEYWKDNVPVCCLRLIDE